MLSILARIDFAQIVTGILISIPAAALGALIKGFLSRHVMADMRADRAAARKEREAAVEARDAAHASRDRALDERETALKTLVRREAEAEQQRKQLDELQRKLGTEREKLDRLLHTLRESDTSLWTTFPRRPPFIDFDSRIGRRKPLIMTVANNKGGVGKTTVVGNLIAYFDTKRKKRVLAIDMDYQGSLSTLLRAERDEIGERHSNVNALLARDAQPMALLSAMRSLGGELGRSRLVPSFYELALLEDRLMVEWLLQENEGNDVRYRLANVLLHPHVQQAFDIILIDVPPRLSAGTINALCTSTHLLVPSIFNPLAAEPVSNFLTASKSLLDELNPKLEFLGVIETMAPPRNQGQGPRARGRSAIEEALIRFPGLTIMDAFIPRRQPMSEGGVAYLADAEVRGFFDNLGDEISRKMGLQ